MRLEEDRHLTVRPLGRKFGSEVPSHLSGAAVVVSRREAASMGPDTSPGRASGPCRHPKWQGAYASPFRATSTVMVLVTWLWKNATSCDFTVKYSPRTFGYGRDSIPLLLPRWVPAEPADANAKRQHGLSLGDAGFRIVCPWTSLPSDADVPLGPHRFLKDSIFKHR